MSSRGQRELNRDSRTQPSQARKGELETDVKSQTGLQDSFRFGQEISAETTLLWTGKSARQEPPHKGTVQNDVCFGEASLLLPPASPLSSPAMRARASASCDSAASLMPQPPCLSVPTPFHPRGRQRCSSASDADWVWLLALRPDATSNHALRFYTLQPHFSSQE